MIHGPVRAAGAGDPLDVDELRLGPAVALLEPSTLVRVGAYIGGGGPTAGVQQVVAVLRNSATEEIAVSAPVAIDTDDPAAWVGFTFDAAGLLLEAGDYTVGVRGQPTGNVARVYAAAAGGGDAIFLETLAPFVFPDADDLTLARLPFELTQRVFAGGVAPSTRQVLRAGWHGQAHDDEEAPAVAIARTGGPLEELVGERVRVARRTGTGELVVFLYVYNEEDWPDDVTDEDFSMPLRPWLELAGAAEESIEVEVEVLK